MTDGRITPAEGGDTLKTFSSQDGFAIKHWRSEGGRVGLISGRRSTLVDRRAKELGIDFVHTGIDDKTAAFESVLSAARVSAGMTAYIGDDIPDVPVMKLCGVPIAVADAVPVVKRAAAYVTRRCGGRGAVAEAVEWLLRLEGRWSGERTAR